MKGLYPLLVPVIAFVMFVFLAREFSAFLEFDSCLDNGGAVVDGLCTGDRRGSWVVGGFRSFPGWLVALGVPAVAVATGHAVLVGLLRRLVKARKDKTL